MTSFVILRSSTWKTILHVTLIHLIFSPDLIKAVKFNLKKSPKLVADKEATNDLVKYLLKCQFHQNPIQFQLKAFKLDKFSVLPICIMKFIVKSNGEICENIKEPETFSDLLVRNKLNDSKLFSTENGKLFMKHFVVGACDNHKNLENLKSTENIGKFKSFIELFNGKNINTNKLFGNSRQKRESGQLMEDEVFNYLHNLNELYDNLEEEKVEGISFDEHMENFVEIGEKDTSNRRRHKNKYRDEITKKDGGYPTDSYHDQHYPVQHYNNDYDVSLAFKYGAVFLITSAILSVCLVISQASNGDIGPPGEPGSTGGIGDTGAPGANGKK